MADYSDSSESGVYETRAEAFRSGQSIFKYWQNALGLAEKEEKNWAKQVKDVRARYEAEENLAFNILFSNTETMRNAVYNSVPLPDIRTRNTDINQDPMTAMVAQQAAAILERGLSYSFDEYDFNDEMKSTVLATQLDGRGVARIRYKPAFQTVDIEDPETGEVIKEERVVNQEVHMEYVPSKRFRRGPGYKWRQVPWVAFAETYDKDALRKLIEVNGGNPEIAEAVNYDVTDGKFDDEKVEEEKSPFRKALVWAIWDKATRKVYYICMSYSTGPIAVMDDPYGLRDFFPMPRPMYFAEREDSLTPIVPYELYKKQADELGRVSQRILALIEVCKWRGLSAGGLKEISDVVNLADGQFKPIEGGFEFAQGAKLDDMVWVMPLRELVQVIKELVLQREQIKQVIYEITGIADVMRGVSNPHETLGAQEIKAQWGSLRVQDHQSEVQRFVRDILRLKSEIIADKFTSQTMSLLAGAEVPTPILELMRNDVRRSFLIDIESDSTIRQDLSRSQTQFANFMQGVSQYAQAIVPGVQMGIIPAKLAIVVFAAFSRNFKLGKEVEDALAEAIQGAAQNPPGEPTPEEQRKQAEAEELEKRAQIGNIRESEAEASLTEAETLRERVETARLTRTPIENPNGRTQ